MRQVILFGSYARGDFRPDSDVDIMILLDMSDVDLKAYSQQLSYMTYDFNLDNDLDIKPIAKSEEHFRKWVVNYPFYANINEEGVVLYEVSSIKLSLSVSKLHTEYCSGRDYSKT